MNRSTVQANSLKQDSRSRFGQREPGKTTVGIRRFRQRGRSSHAGNSATGLFSAFIDKGQNHVEESSQFPRAGMGTWPDAAGFVELRRPSNRELWRTT
jgi:hypothetical protein